MASAKVIAINRRLTRVSNSLVTKSVTKSERCDKHHTSRPPRLLKALAAASTLKAIRDGLAKGQTVSLSDVFLLSQRQPGESFADFVSRLGRQDAAAERGHEAAQEARAVAKLDAAAAAMGLTHSEYALHITGANGDGRAEYRYRRDPSDRAKDREIAALKAQIAQLEAQQNGGAA